MLKNVTQNEVVYKSKIELLNRKDILCEDFTHFPDDHPLEKVHTKFIKFSLAINKFASNHAIRAETGRYPLEKNLINKLNWLDTGID